MKNLNKKGFTLIELLAVIVIMGILMFVAIPAVSRTIENSRKDTFKDTARQYANHVKTLWAADGLVCGLRHTVAAGATYSPVVSTAVADGTYIVPFSSDSTNFGDYTLSGKTYTRPVLLQSGGKSSWANAHVTGFVKVTVASSKATFEVVMRDTSGRGVYTLTDPDSLKRNQVLLAQPATLPTGVAVNADDGLVTSLSAADIDGICEEV